MRVSGPLTPRSRRRPARVATILAAGAVLAMSPGVARPSGFQIQEQSGRALGTAFVGEAAVAEDASTIFFNPAGMTRLTGTQAVVGGMLIWPQARFHDEGSHLSPAVGGGPLHGDNGGNGGALGTVPSGYLAHQ